MVHLEGLAHIGAFFDRKPALGGDDPQKRIVVNRGLPQQVLIAKILIEFLDGEAGIGFAFDLDGLEAARIQAPGAAGVCAVIYTAAGLTLSVSSTL
jgi:hypothetical protein